MRITMIGTGYVGLVSGACFSEFGIDVTCVDKDEEKIIRLQRGEIPIYEPGLDTMVQDNMRAGRLHFTTDTAKAVADADAVFLAVGTPPRPDDGQADLQYVFAAAEEVARALQGYTVIVTKSTVPVGTGERLREIISRTNPEAEFDMASNPEFLREGSAIGDFMRPDRVVVGLQSDRAFEVISRLYRPLSLQEVPILYTDIPTAELTKYAANTFLAAKITFINEIADLCEKVGANVQEVAKGIGLDKRIGEKFLHTGPGYGGSCFPKDTQALVHLAQQANAPIRIIETVVAVNAERKRRMAEKIIAAAGGTVAGKRLAILGLTFKPDTDDMRDAASLVILPALLEAGAELRVYDPEGMPNAKSLLPPAGIHWCDSEYAAMDGADMLVILTEWNEFRNLQLTRCKSLLKTPLMVDLRNIYKRRDMENAGFTYYSLGRRPVLGQANDTQDDRPTA